MSLLYQSKKFLGWFWQVFLSFWKNRPGLTLFVVLSAVIERFSSLLAFVLPLKILLLASADGVPRYFQSFILSDEKATWIFALSSAAFFFFLLGLGLSVLSDRLAAIGGREVVLIASEIVVVNGQEDKIRNYYSTCCQILSGGTFVLLALSVLAIFNVRVLIALLSLIVIEYLFSALSLRSLKEIRPSRIARFIHDELSGYLSLFVYGNFIACFMVILIPFVLGEPAGVVVAVVSILLLRYTINTLASMVKDCVKLWRWKDGIDPLVFRHVQVKKKERRESAGLRQLLAKENREYWVGKHLSSLIDPQDSLTVEWVDSIQKNVNTFFVSSDEPIKNTKKLLLQVFDSRWRHILVNEDYLFERVARRDLLAPELVLSFSEHGYSCQLLDVKNGSRVSEEAWRNAKNEILLAHWAYSPPKNLVAGYKTSHPLLHQRVTNELIRKVFLGADTAEESDLLNAFMGSLSELREIARKLPLYICNPNVNRENIFVSDDINEEYFVTNWGRWSLEPIGIQRPSNVSSEGLNEMIRELKCRRTGLPEDFRIAHVDLAASFSRLEWLINTQRYKAAMEEMLKILENPLVLERSPSVESA